MVVVSSEKEKEIVVNRDTISYMKKLGAFDATACMNCGLCTVSCPLSVSGNEFPRKMIRYASLGLEDKLASHPEPWLCFYCGECSDSCPSKAEPGEFMMAYRRFLISKYDWTGISRRLYSSEKLEILSIILLALGVLAFFVLIGSFGRMETDHVSINTFAPVELIWITVLVVIGLSMLLLLSNGLRMFYFIMIKDQKVKVPIKFYFSELQVFVVQMFTQKNWLKCDMKFKRWFKHFIGVTAEFTVFIFIILLLPIFQRDTSQWHWSALPGYYITAVLTFLTIDSLIGRRKKKEQMHKHSHPSDWIFLIMPLLTVATGMFLHLFRLVDFPLPAYYMYVIHLMIAIPMMIIEVPFGKWSHMLYRPLGIYLAGVKRKAEILALA